ncbi:MFS transporter [Roseisalinus antarcticus]|uniref:Putative multidrug resistance protein EmrY n=1 Tax=Roseisalinus antarcticus TaxID=254357 RepID=A0A1Y5RI03_9RHOB|nr:MFS transporter [Roseisalinus antarcticus]SLN17614.1 putative multidrug resistance protein EmrY [Roseisalinus antarcticus]
MTDSIPPPASGQAPRKPGPVFVSGFCDPGKRHLILIAAVLASAMGFIDGTVVPIAIPAIRSSLGASLGEATWINNAYMLTLSALILAGGAFGDRFGLARVFTLGIGLFVVTSTICALAPSPELLIIARFAQGVGASLMVPGSLAILSRAYPREERGTAIGTWAAAAAVTTAAGPIIGGLILALGGVEMWRGIFVINIPIGLVAIWLVRRGVREDNARPGDPIDLRGAALASAGLGALAWAMTHAEYGQVGPLLFSVAGAGVLILGLFVLHEWRCPAPMLPLSLFASRTFSAANFVTFTLYFGLSAILFFLPILVIAAWSIPEIFAAAALAPLSIFMMLFSRGFGRMALRVGPGVLIGTGALLVAVAYGWLANSVESNLFWAGVLPPMALGGLGMAMVVAPLSTAVMGSVSEGQTGAASGVNNAVSRIAGLFAVAAMSSVVSRAYAAAGGPLSYGIPSDAEGHAQAMVAAFASVAWIAAGLAALSSLVAFAGVLLPKD